MFLQVAGEKPTIQPELLFQLKGFPVTNAILTGFLITVFLFFIVVFIKKRMKMIPGRLQLLAEITVESFLHLLEQITGTRKRAEQLLPLIGALFLYVGISNIITLIPPFSAFSFAGVPMFRTPTNDFNTTFSFALAMIVLINVVSIKNAGLFSYLGKFIKIKGIYLGFKKGLGAGAMAIVEFLIGLLDIISELAKIISLSLRLFGNMYAGDVLLVILFGAFALAAPTIWIGMSLLTGVLQALVFGALTAAYFTLAVQTVEAKNENN